MTQVEAGKLQLMPKITKPIELIEYAYEKTIESIDKLNFPYINKILENWYENGLLTKSQIDSANIKRNSNPETEKKSYSFDICLLYTSPSPRDA